MGPDIERLRLTAGGIQPSPTQTKCHDRSVSTIGQTPGDTIKCSSNYFFFLLYTCTTFSHNGTQTDKKVNCGGFVHSPLHLIHECILLG